MSEPLFLVDIFWNRTSAINIRIGGWSDMNMAIVWMLILIVMLAVEVSTMGLTSIWFAFGALAAAILALLKLPLAAQVAAFLIVSLVTLIFTRPIAVKYFNKDRVRTNVESMIGKRAIVTAEIDNLHGVGCVNVSGQEWSAKSSNDQTKFSVGDVVEVVSVQGVKLVVKDKERED